MVDRAAYENVDVGLDRKPIHDYAWSPDSRYLAYSKMNADLLYQVHIYDTTTGESRPASDGRFNDFGPVFSASGTHLLFVSNRRFDPTFCDFEWEMVYKKVAGIYAVTLEQDGPAFLPPQSDEVALAAQDDTADATTDGTEEEPAGDPTVTIAFDGLAQRIEAIPVPRGNYRALASTDEAVFFLDAESGDFNRFEYRAAGPFVLHAFELESRDKATVIAGIDTYALSADGSHIVYRKKDDVGLIKSSARKASHTALDLSGLKMRMEPHREWTQIFHESWRMERDFFYDENLHGLDWTQLRDQYAALLPALSCRQDLRYVIGELIGELNTSHTYVSGGDRRRRAKTVSVGMLGVDWAVSANHYRFARIFRTADWTRGVVPPLGRPGVDVREGDYLIAVNGHAVTADRNVYSYFQDLAGQQVTLRVNDKPSASDAREVVVQPLSSERVLRYVDWTEQNRRIVSEASGGRIGYLHFPDTYLGSAREFPRFFYGQTRKAGLIVDGRFNGGGLDPDIFLQRLDKPLLALWTRRYSHHQTTPFVVTTAHMACLTNRQAGSGGDMLPMEFQLRKMGPVIGTRTWGGLVGVSMFLSMVDGGMLTAPDYRIYGLDGKWIVENTGVQPDIEVELHPQEMARGHDAQLHKAIEVLMQKIEQEPRGWPEHEPFPIDR